MGLSRRQAFNPYDVLNALKTVDGHGSGLDADMVDGLHGVDLVQVNGYQGILGQKAFAVSPLVPDPTELSAAANKAYVDAQTAAGISAADILTKLKTVAGPGSGLDADTVDGLHGHDLVQIAGAQTVTGAKTFAVSPGVPTPTAATDAANKDYVDAKVAAGGGGGTGTTDHSVLTNRDMAGQHPTASISGLDEALANTVNLTGDQSVSGVKTFASSPAVPTPTNATDAANKDYVDSMASQSGLLDLMQIGETIGSIRTDYDARFLLCNGSPISQSAYPVLYEMRDLGPGGPWTQSNQAAMTAINPNIVFLRNYFIVSSNNSRLYSGPSPTTTYAWNDQPLPSSRASSVRVIWDGTNFVTAGYQGTMITPLYTSSLFTAWTAGNSVNLVSNYEPGFYYADGYYVLVGQGGLMRYNTVLTSVWSNSTVGTVNLNSVVKGNGYWVAVGDAGTLWYKAGNPNAAWTQNNQGTRDFRTVQFLNGYFIATGADAIGAGGFYYATDPTGAWTPVSVNIGGIRDVAFGGGWYVLAGTSSTNGVAYAKSLDGPWIITATGAALNSVTYGNNYFCAVGSSGNLFYISLTAPVTPLVSTGVYTYIKGRMNIS